MTEALALSLVANRYNCYPGDNVTCSLRVAANAAVTGFRLEVELDEGFALDRFTQTPSTVPAPTRRVGEKQLVRWQVTQPPPTCDFAIDGRILPEIGELAQHQPSEEEATSQANEIVLWVQARVIDLATRQSERAALPIRVARQAATLRFLPAIYEGDIFVNQFLFLTESFLKPLQQQLDQIEHYFDPRLTPAPLLPWLATWFDWEFDQDWPNTIAEQTSWQRRLINHLLSLHRTRGTAQGLQTYLALYFGIAPDKVQIASHTHQMAKFDGRTQLGRGFALYQTEQQPHSFSVILTIPAALRQKKTLIEERARRIIAAEKPAHTVLLALDVQAEQMLQAPDDSDKGNTP